MTARLKVFVTGNGFTDVAVAVSSRAKALEAWGVSQDLFREGLARETDDPALVKAALAQPGKPVERPSAGASALPKATAPARPKGPSRAALKRVQDLETQLRTAREDYQSRQADIDAERAALDVRAAKLRESHEAEVGALERRLEQARASLKPD